MAEETKLIPESGDPGQDTLPERSALTQQDSDSHPPAAGESELHREQSVNQVSEGAAPAEHSHENVLQKMRRLSVPERVRLALTGTREERIALIRDANKTVSRAVIESPKVSDDEMELYAAMTDLVEEIYRLISKNVSAMKSYAVIRALANNPRVPIDITLPLVKRLRARELRDLKSNRDVPTALRTLASKLLAPR